MANLLCKVLGHKHVEKTKKGRKIIHSKCLRCGTQESMDFYSLFNNGSKITFGRIRPYKEGSKNVKAR